MNGGWRQIFFLPFFLRTIWWKFQCTSQATSWNDKVKRNERTLKMILFSFFLRLLHWLEWLKKDGWKKRSQSAKLFSLWFLPDFHFISIWPSSSSFFASIFAYASFATSPSCCSRNYSFLAIERHAFNAIYITINFSQSKNMIQIYWLIKSEITSSLTYLSNYVPFFNQYFTGSHVFF